MSLTVRTNGKPRPLLGGPDLTDKELEKFNYLTEDEQACWRFVRYRGQVYDLHEFSASNRKATGTELKKWDGFKSDSFFSGVVVRYKDDDTVVMGTYFS